jgi:hypothetical protein
LLLERQCQCVKCLARSDPAWVATCLRAICQAQRHTIVSERSAWVLVRFMHGYWSDLCTMEDSSCAHPHYAFRPSAGENLLTKKRPIEQDSSEQRTFPRLPITRRGVLTAEDDASVLTTTDNQFPCLIEDMSHGGFLLVCTEKFTVGQILHFSCELLPEQTLDCKIKVMHVGDSTIGTKIVDIDDKSIEICQSFLRNQHSMQHLKKRIDSLKSAASGQN